MKTIILIISCCIVLCKGKSYLLKEIINEEKCDALGGAGTFKKLQNATEDVKLCITQNFNGSNISLELDDDSFGEFVRTFCSRFDKLKKCTENQRNVLELCLTPQERVDLKLYDKTVTRIGKYVCRNDGEKLASIIEKEGMDCFKYWLEVAADNCIKKELNYAPPNGVLSLLKSNKSCYDFAKIQKCILKELYVTYPNSSSVEMINPIMKLIHGGMCKKDRISVRRRRSLRRNIRNIASGGMSNKLKDIERAVKNACIRNGYASEKLNETIDEMKECVNKKVIFEDPVDDYIGNMENCSKPTRTMLEKCLPHQWKYLPSFLFHLIESFIKLLYEDAIILESEISTCLPKLKTEQSEEKYLSCVTQASRNVHTIPDTQSKFCENFIEVNDCFIQQLRDECPQNDMMKRFEKDLKDAIKRPCKQ